MVLEFKIFSNKSQQQKKIIKTRGLVFCEQHQSDVGDVASI